MVFFRPEHFALAVCLYTCVSSEPVIHPRHNPHKVWVTVDASGDAQTITPSVSGSTTVSAAPAYVTQTSVYTLTTASGVVRTSTGVAPVATATASSGAGAFYQCGNYLGWDAPFCQPRRGSVLKPGITYYGKSRMFLSIDSLKYVISGLRRLTIISYMGSNTFRKRGLPGRCPSAILRQYRIHGRQERLG